MGVVILVTSGVKFRAMGVGTVLLMFPKREQLAEGVTLMDLSPPPPLRSQELGGTSRSICSSGSLPWLDGSEILLFT